MPSEEHDSRTTDLDSGITDAHDRLLQISEKHAEVWGKDSFYFFLKIHECIFGRVNNHASVPVRQLNVVFALRCLQVYDDYQNNRVHLLPKRWVNALLAYQKDRYAFFTVLPLIALAHIVDDLEAVLAQVDVTKDDYDLVLDDILACLESVENPLKSPSNVRERILSFLQQRFGATTISTMREIAWRQSRRRRQLARPEKPVL
jgi:Family of unknown function (DUF5995)